MSDNQGRNNYAPSTNSTIALASASQARQIYVNMPLPDDQLDSARKAQGRYVPKHTYETNRIRTSKYTILSFIPKNLFEQFRRVANFFFLLLVILQSFPLFKTVHPIIAALPIIFIVAVTAVKDGVEDYRRWMSDKQVNNRQAFTLGQDHWRNYNYPDIINIRLAKKIRRKIRYYIDLLITQIGLFKDRLEQRTRQYSERPIAIDVGGYRWVQTSWKDIRVGDIIYVQNNDALPADIIVLSTSETDNLCYVETKNLDGETNLKLKQGPTELMWVKQPDDCAVKLKLVIDSEPPTTNMLRYQATILYMPPHDLHTELSLTRNSLDSSAGEQSRTTLDGGKSMEMINKGKKSADIQKRIPVDINGILLRGCVLRNTKWVIGVVVFTGDDTKQILNSGTTPSKQSEVEKRMNPHVMISLMLLVVMCAIVSIGYSVQSRAQNANDTTFGEAAFAPDLEAFVNFFNALILFQNIVPISLYISIEIVKTVQAYFIYSDLELYYEENDTPCVPKSWNLSDNLGQIEYIFSDKTGTLTRNIMEFKKCSIAGVVYDGTGKKSGSDDGLNMQPSRMAQSSRASTYSIKADWVETGKGHNRVSSLIKDDDLLHTPGSTNANKSTKHLKHSSIDAPTIASVMEEEGPILEVDDNVETFFDDALFEYLDDRIKMTTPHGVAIKDFFTLLAVCHTVLLEEKSDRESRNTQNSITQALANNTAKMPVLKYKAQSPDEACLVTFAAECGFVFKGREHNAETEQNEIVIDALGEEARYGLLNVLEFDSDRKRMSVIVRTAGTNGKKGDVILFCKGADSVIFERLLPGQNEAKEKANANLDHFAKDGLRTLCLAYRKVPNEQYESWSKRYFEAVTQIYPDSTARSRALDTLNNEIESKLILLGITAIEDKLQEGVPECITTLADAGIKIWVLTGDKMETAINVGFLCGLLKTTEVFDEDAEVSESEMILIQIKNANNENEVKRQFNAAAERFFASNLLSEPLERSNTGALMNKEFALIIDGQSLKYALESEETKTLMLNIALKCKAVVCCRVSPLQKAKVVEMVKSGRNVITLAIGDGANDVSMIQAAHVGVGISGEEGLQAAMSADYSIAQFKFLQRLLLVHGTWSYNRVSFMILNFYLKSVVFTVIVFWFQFYCGFSAGVIFDFSYMLFYNTIFTLLPIIILGIFDQNVEQNIITAFPQVYGSEGIKQIYYTHRRFFIYLFESFYHSLVCYFVPIAVYANPSTNSSGLIADSYQLGTVIAVAAIIDVNLSVALDTHSWTWMNHVGVWGSCLIIFIFVMILGTSTDSPMYGVTQDLFSQAPFWFSIFLTIVISLGPRFLWYVYKREVRPSDSMVLSEIGYLARTGKIDVNELDKRKAIIKRRSTLSEKKDDMDKKPDQDGRLMRKPSTASFNSVSYSMETGSASKVHGFSFAHTLGMGNVILRSPLGPLFPQFKPGTLQISRPSSRTRSRWGTSNAGPSTTQTSPTSPPPVNPAINVVKKESKFLGKGHAHSASAPDPAVYTPPIPPPSKSLPVVPENESYEGTSKNPVTVIAPSTSADVPMISVQHATLKRDTDSERISTKTPEEESVVQESSNEASRVTPEPSAAEQSPLPRVKAIDTGSARGKSPAKASVSSPLTKTAFVATDFESARSESPIDKPTESPEAVEEEDHEVEEDIRRSE